MGASTARITAEDFLTPPELAAWRLASNGAGRIGGLRLSLAADSQGTQLRECYQQVPLRILRPFHFSADEPALLYLLNPTAGLMDGDGQLIHLTAGPGTRAVVTGQSASRIHPCLNGFSTQQWHVRVESGAVLVVLPGPAIPFQGCRYYQQARIDLASGARLIWGDIWLAGRHTRGEASEQFQFAHLIQEMTVQREDKLVYRDRFAWRGPWDESSAGWHFGGQLAFGSLFVSGKVTEESLPAGARAANFPTAAGDTCLRWCGDPEAVISCLVKAALHLAAANDGSAREPWLLSSHHLGPNHWFAAQPGSD
jgi:urease accessory protein